jgi:drug/metabolite transporter (DMT)-like permease
MTPRGAAWAIAAASLFGASTPFAKRILDGGRGELAVAGLLYLGATAGLTLILAVRRAPPGDHGLRVMPRSERGWLALATLMGGLVAPALLMVGLSRTSGVVASLLLAVETPATALLAWALFGERLGRRLVAGGLLVLAGAVAVRVTGGASDATFVGAAAIVLSCFAWAVDNNATARIAHHDSLRIARFKCLCAAPFALLLALAFDRDGLLGAAWTPAALVETLVTGMIGYGLSLACFVRALREIGAARTGALFAMAPFLSAIVAIPVLDERPGAQVAVAAALLAAGTFLLVTEPLRERA